MAKKLIGKLKLQVKAGQANPSPPVGPALGQRGINIMEFCKAFNAKTALPNRDLVLSRQILHHGNQDAPRVLPAEEGRRSAARWQA